ncbi:MAG TPA: two-component regulator propeller domain-containing protein, partial [Bacteroidota bacterium]|nr:two-component regulator propeller domain-containing protein [Bacteroidota bacterium]
MTRFLSLFFLLIDLAAAQDVHFERLSINEGLSQTSVYAIAQDSQGFLWFGTQDGLNRYDGYSFKVFRYRANDSTSLSANHISRLIVSRTGELWAGTAARGLNRFRQDKGVFERFLHDDADSTTLTNNNVWSLYEDSRGTIWVGTENGLNALDPATGKCRRYLYDRKSPSGNASWIRSIVEDSSGLIWFGHPQGLSNLDPRTGAFRYFAFPGKEFLSLVRSHDGVIFAVVAENVYQIDYSQDAPARPPILKPVLLHMPGLQTALDAGDASLWIGSVSGLLKFDRVSRVRTQFNNRPDDPASLSENTVLSLFRDRSGILWIGTFGGINKFVPARKRFLTIQCDPAKSMGPRANRVRGFSEDRHHNIWIATESGLYRMDPATRHLDRFVNAPGYPRTVKVNHMWAVLALSDSPGVKIMCATNGGGVNVLTFPEGGDPLRPEMEYIVPNPREPLSLPAPGPSCLFEERGGQVWIGTLREGVARYNPRSRTFEVYKNQTNVPTSLSNRSVTTILQTRDGVVWIGTRGGLNSFNESDKSFKRYMNDPTNPNSLSDDAVECLCEDEAGILWVGTTAGLNAFDRTTGTFRRFTMEDGLPNDAIYGVLKDSHGSLWCSTNKGIARFRPEGGLVESYDVTDGLQSDEFNQG